MKHSSEWNALDGYGRGVDDLRQQLAAAEARADAALVLVAAREIHIDQAEARAEAAEAALGPLRLVAEAARNYVWGIPGVEGVNPLIAALAALDAAQRRQ